MTVHDTIVVLDFGSQTSQLIARRVREAQVYCLLLPWDSDPEQVLALQPRGFVLSGGPASVYEPDAPPLPQYVLDSGRPLLGICYGMQLLAHALGGHVAPASRREYGPAQAQVTQASPLLAPLSDQPQVWMSHGDRVDRVPPGFAVLARSDNSPTAAMGDLERHRYGVQFHPEVAHTPAGAEILRRFAVEVCGCTPTWTAAAFVEEAIACIRRQVGEGRVVCGLSGGVDSSVTATLVHQAIGERLTCIFVNTGMLRQGEPEQVARTFRDQLNMPLVAIDATETFLSALERVADPEQKRKIIGEQFIRIFEREARRLGKVDYLAQGTLYPDIIESAAADRPGARRIKSHHNVGGLPERMELELVEPLRYLFKDEVRAVGELLGLPRAIVWRHPFPGPGLAVRIPDSAVTWERLEMLRAADAILLQELEAAGWYHRVAQAFAVLLPVRSVGVMGDQRTHGYTIALRAVTTDDFMTASWARLPYDLLDRVATRITNEVPGVSRVLYDCSNKPPATIEFE
ncbi:MAG: glutamine-hydrolyzing GMP synthase [Anaerolineae bacterium]|nr:glutamine-hydrolyzing GMP synthase [Anaerolineae bacterium]